MTSTYNNAERELPSLPKKLEIHNNIKILFDPNRTSSDLLDIYINSYNLYKTIRDNNYIDFMTQLNRGYEYTDYTSFNGNSLIMEAVGKDIKILKTLLDLALNVNTEDPISLNRALHLAVQNGEYDDMQLLIDHDAYVNAINANQESPLAIAVKNNDIRAVEILLNAGADPTIGYIGDYSILGKSIRSSNDSITLKLITKMDNLNSVAINDWTNIHLAAKYSSLRVLNALLKKGVNVNVIKENSMTPLIIATYYEGDDKKKRIESLIKSGANPDITSKNGYNALLTYLSLEYIKIIKPLVDEGKNQFIEVDNFAPLLKYLMSITSNLEHKNNDNQSCLYYLVNYGSKDDINFYLANTPNQTEKSKQSFEILRTLMHRGLKKEFERVLKRCEDINYKTKEGLFLLFLSYTDSNFNWASKSLLSHGSDINLTGPHNTTILEQLQFQQRYDEIIRLLDSGQKFDNLKQIIRKVNRLNDEKSIEFINKLRSRDIKVDFKPQYFTTSGGDFWIFNENNFDLELSENMVTIKNNDVNRIINSRNEFPNNKDFTISFTLEDYDTGLELWFYNKNIEIKNIMIPLVNNRTSIKLPTKEDPNKLEYNDFKYLFEKGNSYTIKIRKRDNKIELTINNELQCEAKLQLPISPIISLFLYEGSTTKIKSFQYISEGK